jgi:chaperonin GroES
MGPGDDDMQTASFRPLYDRVLVKRIDAETRSAGGLYIPDNAKEKPQQAMVVAIGTGRILKDGTVRALEVKAGDRVLFGKYSGDEIKLDGESHLILREDDILAVLEA